MGRDYLLEIGCEEIPAGFVGPPPVLGAPAVGFASPPAMGVSPLPVFPTDRGGYLGFVREEAARPVQEILPKIVSDFLPAIPFKKSMRGAELGVRFARPVHWIVSLSGGGVLPVSFG